MATIWSERHVDGGDIRVVWLRRALDGFHKFHDLGAVEEIAAGVAPLGTIFRSARNRVFPIAGGDLFVAHKCWVEFV